MSENKHFTAVVIGDNPETFLGRYDSTIKMEPYIVYKRSEASIYKRNYIKAYNSIINNQNTPDYMRESYKEALNVLNTQTDDEFYEELTCDFDHDNEGNAICTINPNGKYVTCRLGKNLSLPLITKNGKEVFQARKCDIDWSQIHLAKQDVYKTAWELVMEGRIPKTEEEKIIYKNMKNRTEYFRFFGTKELYVINNTAFWGYAFVDKEHWFELEDGISQKEWVCNFYDNFIKNLPDDTLISIYECTRN